ncbi:hypothetical protein KIL84_009974 [Mauremys mutica]|uniref:Uncharacterized protein n=1 Tax=Mauremys mutica TaxID=74926 RepID=A0A9D4B6I9_9SAUR|nr:hypothetical protein KIL84_009974 [Mauremys mutica]
MGWETNSRTSTCLQGDLSHWPLPSSARRTHLSAQEALGAVPIAELQRVGPSASPWLLGAASVPATGQRPLNRVPPLGPPERWVLSATDTSSLPVCLGWRIASWRFSSLRPGGFPRYGGN